MSMKLRDAVTLAVVLAGAVAAQSSDAGAGNWQTIVLTGPTQISVAPPVAVTDAAYLAELASIKAAQASITADQQKSIDYWAAGGAMRWNQILIELVAAADLPPEPNADGTYPAPDPSNPFAFPQYPFSNPPYAARAYSYVSVAQYEALKVAWYYKYLYNRPSPARVDGSIKALRPATDLPGYPSEDAVLAAVTAPLLKLLFPTAVDTITRRAAEQQQAALLSGRATASDLAAGAALGQAVAAIFVSRASTDGMKAASGTTAQWQAMAAAAAARGEIPWKSQEIPPRPPMLPLFGNVKGWMMSPADILKERPPAPPSTSSPQMAQELAEVKRTVEGATREQLAIAYKWNDGASSPTPPGHWNLIAAPYIAQAGWSEVRVARAYALLNMALHDASVGCWDAKFAYYTPRAAQLDPTIKMLIPLPNFPSYTSGHSTYSAAAAEVLSYLFPSGAAYFAAQKDEAAISRLYAGIHFRSDIEMGKTHGKAIGGYTVRYAQQDGADSAAPGGRTGEVRDSASYRAPLAAGSMATVFQADLGSAPDLAGGPTLPNTLGGVSMRFNDAIAVPIYYASANQANIQIPWELEGMKSATLTVTDAKGGSSTIPVALSAFAPAIFRVGQEGNQGAVILGRDGALAAAEGSIPGVVSRAGAKGEFLSIYCLGLGAVNHPPATGRATPDQSSTTKAPVTVLLNGASIPAVFAGLAPGFVGLFQVDAQIPEQAPSGDAVPLVLSVGGARSNTVTVAIR